MEEIEAHVEENPPVIEEAEAETMKKKPTRKQRKKTEPEGKS